MIYNRVGSRAEAIERINNQVAFSYLGSKVMASWREDDLGKSYRVVCDTELIAVYYEDENITWINEARLVAYKDKWRKFCRKGLPNAIPRSVN